MTPVRLDTVRDVGCLVRQLRIQLGLTQRQLAERAGVPVRSLARLERGEAVDFSLRRALRLMRVLGLRVQASPTPPGPTLTEVLNDVREGGNTGPCSR